MKTMKNTKWIAIATVLAATLTGSVSDVWAKEASSEAKVKKKSVAKGDAVDKSSVQNQVRRYAANYNLNEADQAGIEKILLAQQKDLADYKKVHGAKIAAIDEQIAKLQDEILKLTKPKQDEIRNLAKSRDVYLKVRDELALDHKAELDKAITTEQKTAHLVRYLRGYSYDMTLAFLPKEIQATLTRQYQTAAMELVSSGSADSRTAVKEASRKLHESIGKIVTPEMRRTAETKYLQDSAIRSFARYELTDAQKASIGELCAKNIKDRAATAERYAQIRKDYEAARQAMSKGRGSYSSYSAIREEIAEKILTEEQKKKQPSKHKSSSRKDRKDKPSGKKPPKNTTE